MKFRLLVLGILIFGVFQRAYSQPYAVVDMRYILSKVPEHVEAKNQLDQLSKTWQKEIDDKQYEFDQMINNYKADEALLTDALKKQRQDLILAKEKEVRDLQRKRFGSDGDLAQKRKEIETPIVDRVYEVIKKMAVDRKYAFVLDRSEGITVMFNDPKLNKSDDVLQQMGLLRK